MDVLTPPSLDLACPQTEAEIKKYVHMFRARGVDKNKIRTWGHHDHSYNGNIYRFFSYDLLFSSNNLFTMSSMVQKLH